MRAGIAQMRAPASSNVVVVENRTARIDAWAKLALLGEFDQIVTSPLAGSRSAARLAR
jgi:hypothetical protein